MKKWLIFSFLLLLAASGCDARNDTRNNADYTPGKNRSVPDNMSYRSVGRDQRHLVEDDITNQNPNFLDLNRTGTGTENSSSNLGIDVDKARQTIALTKEFKPGSVWINNAADHMQVTAYKKGPLTAKQRKAAEVRLRRQLIAALPRYTFKVTVLEDKR